MPKFSIITPTYNRASERYLGRCLNSVWMQTFKDFEHITVDDGSKDYPGAIVDHYDTRFRCVHREHGGRLKARNTGMQSAEGEWICWLDSDDAYDPMYLATFNHYIDSHPDINLWVCGAVVHGMVKQDGKHVCPKWTKIRKSWKPPLADGSHAVFNSGHVGTGMFVFCRSCLDVTGLFPNEWNNFNHIADGLDEWLGLPPGTTGYGSDRRLVGNPWGDDHAMFQHLCLHFEAHTIDAALYTQYVR